MRYTSVLVLVIALCFFTGCKFSMNVTVNGKTYAILEGTEFVAVENIDTVQYQGAKEIKEPFSGVYMKVGYKFAPNVLDRTDFCGEPNKLYWRTWFRANKKAFSCKHNEPLLADTWHADYIDPDMRQKGDPRLRFTPVNDIYDKDMVVRGFKNKFVDKPCYPTSIGKGGDFTWEAITCLVCSNRANYYEALGCFSWAWSMDANGKVTLINPSEIPLEEFKKIRLPNL